MSIEAGSVRRSHRLGRALIYGSLAALAAFYLMPLWVMIVTSLKSLDEIYSGSFIGLPSHLTRGGRHGTRPVSAQLAAGYAHISSTHC